MYHIWSRISLQAQKVLDEKPWLRTIVLSSATASILIISIPVWLILFLERDRRIALLIRYLPLALLVVIVLLAGMRLNFFKDDRKKWYQVLWASSICNGGGIVLLTFLFKSLENPSIVGLKEKFFGQAVSILSCMVFFKVVYTQSRRERFFSYLFAGMVCVFLLLQWGTFPKKLWSIQPIIGLYASLFIFGLPLLVGGFLRGWNWLIAKYQGKVLVSAKVTAIIILVCLGFFYTQAAFEHLVKVNKKINSSDQAFYIQFIKEVYQSGFRSTGDHNRMPLYPYFQALFYRPEMSDKDLFRQGKSINIILSLLYLGSLCLVFIKRLRFAPSILLVILTAFSLYIFKAPYLQAELTFFTLAFISFLLMLEMLQHPNWLLSLSTGLAAGLTYLTKGTVLPSLLLFAVCFGVKIGQQAFLVWKKSGRSVIREIAKEIGYLLVSLLMFFAIVFPYIQSMKQKFGHYFYNVNTTVYIWYENYDQALEEEAKYHFTQQWPVNLGDDQIPGLRNYLRDHTSQQILERFQIGLGKLYQNMISQLGVTNYLFSYAFIVLIAFLIDPRNSIRLIMKYPWLALFIILYFGGYLFAFSWYSLIAGGRRFLLGLYLPFLYIVFLFLDQLAKSQMASPEGTSASGFSILRFIQASHLLMAFTLVYNIWLVLTKVLFFGRFGS